MKPLFSIKEVFDIIGNAKDLLTLAYLSRILEVETDKYTLKEMDAFLILMTARREMILNGDVLDDETN